MYERQIRTVVGWVMGLYPICVPADLSRCESRLGRWADWVCSVPRVVLTAVRTTRGYSLPPLFGVGESVAIAHSTSGMYSKWVVLA